MMQTGTRDSLPERRTDASTAPADDSPAELESYNWYELLSLQGSAFLSAAYRIILFRDPDPDGLCTYGRRLQQGMSKTSILIILRGSPEFARLEKSDNGASVADPLREAFLATLRKMTALYYIAHVPIVGAIIKSFVQVEGNSRIERRLRSLEFKLAEVATCGLHMLAVDELPEISSLDRALAANGHARIRRDQFDDAADTGEIELMPGVDFATHPLFDKPTTLRTLPPPRNWI